MTAAYASDRCLWKAFNFSVSRFGKPQLILKLTGLPDRAKQISLKLCAKNYHDISFYSLA